MRLKITTKNKTTQKSALTSAKPQRATPAAGVEAAEKAIERELRTAGFPMEMDDLKEYAETKYTDEEFEARRQLYPFAMPFTKESLLYREIFEKYYPGQAEMVKDFWMPNKSWEGCNVNDPSARVLSNYGASGE